MSGTLDRDGRIDDLRRGRGVWRLALRLGRRLVPQLQIDNNMQTVNKNKGTTALHIFHFVTICMNCIAFLSDKLAILFLDSSVILSPGWRQTRHAGRF